MIWECLVEGKNFIIDLGEDKLSPGGESNRFAVWILDSVNEGKHRMVEIGFNLSLLKAKYDVDSECIFTLVRMDNENVRESVYVNECENVSNIFQSLPLAALTCGPLRAAAQGETALSQVYLDTLLRHAVEDSSNEMFVDNVACNKDGTLKFTHRRSIKDEVTGEDIIQEYEIKIPLWAFVPIP